MAVNYLKNNLDDIDWRIIEALQVEGRVSLSELGRRVYLSQPAVAERVRRLEESEVISGYRAEIEPSHAGLPIAAFVRFTSSSPAQSNQVIRLLNELPEVLECYRITGNDCFIMKVVASDTKHLETVIDRLSRYGTTSTSLVLSCVLKRPISHLAFGSIKEPEAAQPAVAADLPSAALRASG